MKHEELGAATSLTILTHTHRHTHTLPPQVPPPPSTVSDMRVQLLAVCFLSSASLPLLRDRTHFFFLLRAIISK